MLDAMKEDQIKKFIAKKQKIEKKIKLHLKIKLESGTLMAMEKAINQFKQKELMIIFKLFKSAGDEALPTKKE